MKLIFSHWDDVGLQHGQVNALMMESTSSLYFIRKVLFDWIHGRPMSSLYMSTYESEKEVFAKQCYVIHINQAIFELEHDKDYYKWITQHLKYLLLNDEYFINHYQKLMNTMEQLVLNSTITFGDVKVDFDLTEKLLEGILKQLSVQISSDKLASLSSIELRKLFIETLLQLNVQKKPVYVVYEFPENDASSKEYGVLIEYLNSLSATVICLSNNRDFVKHLDIENVNLMYDNGSKYPVIKLSEELQLFGYVELSRKVQFENTLMRKLPLSMLLLTTFFRDK